MSISGMDKHLNIYIDLQCLELSSWDILSGFFSFFFKFHINLLLLNKMLPTAWSSFNFIKGIEVIIYHIRCRYLILFLESLGSYYSPGRQKHLQQESFLDHVYMHTADSGVCSTCSHSRLSAAGTFLGTLMTGQLSFVILILYSVDSFPMPLKTS